MGSTAMFTRGNGSLFPIQSGGAGAESAYMQYGEPVPRPKTSWNNVSLYYVTQEQADTLWQILDAADFTPSGGVKDKVTDIILDEIGAYLDGTRSAQDTAKIIQNRVRTMVQERGTKPPA